MSGVTFLQVLTPVFVAMVGLGAPYLVYRQNKKATDTGNKIEQTKIEAQGFRDIREGYAELLAEIRGAKQAADQRISELEQKVEAQHEKSLEQDAKIRRLEQARDSDRRRIAAAVRYIRELRRMLLDRGETPPPVPAELHHELDG